MKKIERFEDLEVWQLARELVKQVYCLTAGKTVARDFGLAGQMQRSAVSVMANIAEGFERRSNKEFIHFLYLLVSETQPLALILPLFQCSRLESGKSAAAIRAEGRWRF